MDKTLTPFLNLIQQLENFGNDTFTTDEVIAMLKLELITERQFAEETAYRLGYIEGCKATHEKMLKLIELAYKEAFKEGKATQMWGYSNDNGDEDWQSFKTEHNL